jgi:uncharacterized membrane protein
MAVSLSPKVRRVVQAVLYEALALAFVAPMLSWLFGRSAWSTLALTLLMSSIALAWNYVFNALFERWEAKQAERGRNWKRRALHGLGFEGGLALMLVPVMSLWLDISLWQALVADIGILLFFLVYTVVFTWCFDRIFGLPASALRADSA